MKCKRKISNQPKSLKDVVKRKRKRKRRKQFNERPKLSDINADKSSTRRSLIVRRTSWF